jgi:tripeptidyl-peptidase I
MLMLLRFMKLALQGHTIFFSSGDTGVAGRPTDPRPNGCLGDNHTIFNPRWPDSCPYLTVVGGTQVYAGFTVNDPESAANDPPNYSTGGGFSNIYPIPDYQAKAVATYFGEHDPGYPYYGGNQSLGYNGGLYNRTGRGYPDVSANSDNIAVYVGGRAGREGGTSASKCKAYISEEEADL